MAIKIEIEAASAAEMHQELATLLFGLGGEKEFRKIVVEPSEGIIGQEAGGAVAKPEPEEVKEAPKKKRRTKAEIEAEKDAKAEADAKTAEAATAPVDEPEEDGTPETQDMPKEESKPEAGKQYDIDDVRQLIMVKGSSKKGLVGSILKSYGVKVLPELSHEQLQEVYTKIEAL